jgi:glycosyltransferase involved in cell wall biosynthesis
MPATFLAAKIKGKPIVYDTHEYYLGMPELEGKLKIKKIWQTIERYIFPRVKYIYTICQSFCDLYYNDYGKQLWYIQNVPQLNINSTGQFENHKKEIDAKIPTGRKILLFQGAGINVERGVEELVLSMQYLDANQFHLLIVGGGDLFDVICNLVKEKSLSDRITIIPKVPFEVLKHITHKAHLGFTLDKPTNINHIYGLPNKIFDYLHAGVPVLSSRLIELEKIIQKYNVGTFIENHDPVHIANCIVKVFEQPQLLEEWTVNTQKVKRDFNWENEEKKLLNIFYTVSQDAALVK